MLAVLCSQLSLITEVPAFCPCLTVGGISISAMRMKSTSASRALSISSARRMASHACACVFVRQGWQGTMSTQAHIYSKDDEPAARSFALPQQSERTCCSGQQDNKGQLPSASRPPRSGVCRGRRAHPCPQPQPVQRCRRPPPLRPLRPSATAAGPHWVCVWMLRRRGAADPRTVKGGRRGEMCLMGQSTPGATARPMLGALAARRRVAQDADTLTQRASYTSQAPTGASRPRTSPRHGRWRGPGLEHSPRAPSRPQGAQIAHVWRF
jgi:hypothetical protein